MPKPRYEAQEPDPVDVPEDVDAAADRTGYKDHVDPLAWSQGVEETKVPRYAAARKCVVKPQVIFGSIRRSNTEK